MEWARPADFERWKRKNGDELTLFATCVCLAQNLESIDCVYITCNDVGVVRESFEVRSNNGFVIPIQFRSKVPQAA